MVTRLPRGKVAPKAALSLAQNSGVRSIFTRPVMPLRPNSTRRPCEPQIMLELIVAPSSTSLLGQILTFAPITAPALMIVWSPTTAPSNSTARLLILHWRSTIAPRSPLTDVGVAPDDRSIDRRTRIHHRVIANSGWAMDDHAALDLHPMAQKHRAIEMHIRADLGIALDPQL